MSQFDEQEQQQSYGPRLYEKAVVGHLLLVWATEYKEKGTAGTQFNANADAIVVDCVDLSDIDPETGQPPVSYGVWWRGGAVIGALRGRIGRDAPMLAYMGTEPSGKGNPKYVLVQAHQDPWAREEGTRWMNAHPDFRKPPGDGGADFVPTVTRSAPAPEPTPTGARVQATAPVPVSQESVLERLRRASQAAQAQAQRIQQEDKPPY